MAISTTELGTVWEPATSLWDRAIALNSASFPFPNNASAQGKKRMSMPRAEVEHANAYIQNEQECRRQNGRNAKSVSTQNERLSVRVGLTYVHFELVLEELEGDY